MLCECTGPLPDDSLPPSCDKSGCDQHPKVIFFVRNLTQNSKDIFNEEIKLVQTMREHQVSFTFLQGMREGITSVSIFMG